jgi:hypothetical protein
VAGFSCDWSQLSLQVQTPVRSRCEAQGRSQRQAFSFLPSALKAPSSLMSVTLTANSAPSRLYGNDTAAKTARTLDARQSRHEDPRSMVGVRA